jgi:hypothetical protein
MPVLSATQEVNVARLQSEVNWAKKPVQKTLKAKWSGGMAQVIQQLPSKYDALSVSFSTKKKKLTQ